MWFALINSVCGLILRYPKLADGNHGLLKKQANVNLKNGCKKIAAECLQRKQDTFNIGSDPNAAIKDAQGGLWANKKTNKSQPKTKESIVSKMLKMHSNQHQKKKTYNDKILEQQSKQTKAMQNVGKNIGLLSQTDDEYFYVFKDFVITKFKPEHRAEDIIEYSELYKADCISMFRLFERKPDEYDDERKIRMIQCEFDKWLRVVDFD